MSTRRKKVDGLMVHVVVAVGDSYDGGDTPLWAFADPEKAGDSCSELHAYNTKRPDLDSSLEGDAWDKAWARFERWRKRHPAGEYNTRGPYETRPLIIKDLI